MRNKELVYNLLKIHYIAAKLLVFALVLVMFTEKSTASSGAARFLQFAGSDVGKVVVRGTSDLFRLTDGLVKSAELTVQPADYDELLSNFGNDPLSDLISEARNILAALETEHTHVSSLSLVAVTPAVLVLCEERVSVNEDMIEQLDEWQQTKSVARVRKSEIGDLPGRAETYSEAAYAANQGFIDFIDEYSAEIGALTYGTAVLAELFAISEQFSTLSSVFADIAKEKSNTEFHRC